MKRLPYGETGASPLIEFCLKHPYHPHTADTLERFLTQLVSSGRLIFDFWDAGERVLVAVLIDQVQNPGQNGVLEIVGRKGAVGFEALISEAKRELPESKSGIEVAILQGHDSDLKAFKEARFRPYYAMVEMVKEDRFAGKSFSWPALTLDLIPIYHSALCSAFAENVETSVPSLEEMVRNFSKSKQVVRLLYDERKLIGFFSVIPDDQDPTVGDIHLLGIIPSYRGRGLGKVLMEGALSELSLRGVRRYRLSVAAMNENALGLYRAFGFEVVKTDVCLIFKR